MNDDELEHSVIEYLERRLLEPSLTPEDFASGRADDSGRLLGAIRTALELEHALAADGEQLRMIGPYQVLGELGRGGMGIVYRAEREGRPYAVKLLPLAPLVGPRMLERFRREAESLAMISHPGIVRVHDSGMHDEMPYLVMDLIEGRPLPEVAGELSRDAAISLVQSLSEAVAAAHAAGVLHRDLKPQNVVIRPDGNPVLLDFGLSVAEEYPTLTATSEMLGTPRYMAPEQLSGGGEDVRTDVHALGLILYELLTRQPAYTDRSRDGVLDAVRSGRILPPRTVDASIPREIEKVVLVALAHSPSRRYASATEFADDLARFRQGTPVLARPPGWWIRALESTRTAPGRARALGLAAAGVVAISLAFVGVRWSAEVTPQEREQAARLVDHATTLWIDGQVHAARGELAQARRLDPSEPTSRLLSDQLAGVRLAAGTTSCRDSAARGLQAFERGEFKAALAEFRGCAVGGLRESFVAAIVGLSLSHGTEYSAAREQLTAASQLLPASVNIQRRLAAVCESLDRPAEAALAFRRAAELSPDSLDRWVDLAAALLRQRNLDEGFRVLARAESLAHGEDARLLQIRGGLQMHAGQRGEAVRNLERVLVLEPANIAARYQLAYAHDLDHGMVAAEAGYRGVLELDARHVHALVCLANLHSGASRGQCRGCDAAYAAHPEYLDYAKAETYLLRCFEVDRGGTEWVTQSARDITMKLPRRDRVVRLLEVLTASHDGTLATLRLEEVLRRIRLVEG